MAKITDEEQLIKSVKLVLNCLKRAREHPKQKHSWYTIARNQLTRAGFYLDDELDYSQEKIDRLVAMRLKESEKKAYRLSQ